MLLVSAIRRPESLDYDSWPVVCLSDSSEGLFSSDSLTADSSAAGFCH